MDESTPLTDPMIPQSQVRTPRKPRWGRRFAVLLLALVVLLAAGLWAAPGLIAKSSYKERLMASATKDLNGRVEVGGLSLAWFHPIELFDVTVFDADGRKLGVATKVSTSKTLFDYACDRTDLGTIVVDQPRIEVVFTRGATNVEQVITRYLTDETPPNPDRTSIRVEVKNGTVALIDTERNESRELTAIDLTVDVPRLRTDPVRLAVTGMAGGTINAEGEFSPRAKVILKANGFDSASLGPLLRRLDPSAVLAGKVTSDLVVEWGGGDFATQGVISATDLVVGGNWLAGDTLRLKAVELPAKLEYAQGTLSVDHAKITCDAGTASFTGVINTRTVDTLFEQTGLKLDADVDAAMVGTLLPKLLKLKPGTELTGGRLRAKLASTAGPVGTVWTGSLDTTKLEGRRDGKLLSWEQPLTITFKGHAHKEDYPEFEDLTVQSDFIGARARGKLESFDLAVNLELDRLSTHLNDFLDLKGLKLNGSVRNLIVQTRPQEKGGYTLTASGVVSNLELLDRDGNGFREPNLTLKANAEGDLIKLPTGKRIQIETGSLTVNAGLDTLKLTLLESITNLKSPTNGSVQVQLTGNLAQWRARISPLIEFPEEWELGGTAKFATAVLSFDERITAKQVKLNVSNAAFRGLGLEVREPDLILETSDPDNGAITIEQVKFPRLATHEQLKDYTAWKFTFNFVTLMSETLSGSSKRIEFVPSLVDFESTVTADKISPADIKIEYGVHGRANVIAKLDRLQRTLRLQSDPALADQFRGTAEGWVDVQAPTFARLGLNGDLTVRRFEYGPPKSPTWTEPWVRARLDGEYQYATDSILLRTAELSRDGFSANGNGHVNKLTSAGELDVSGNLTYDLSKLEPQLKHYLGKSAAAAGKGTKPFRLTGVLLEGGNNLSVAVGGKPATLTRLSGNAAVAWQSLKAYGFDVGQSEVKATMDQGVVSMTPVDATFGGGKVRLEPSLTLNPGAYDLTFKKGKVVDLAKLTPAACAEAIGYALPAFANSAQADGTFSFELNDNLIPLANPTRGTVKGNLTIHDATVAPGPVVTEVIEVFGLTAPRLQVKKGSVVPVRLENGRVHHTNFAINVGNTPITTTGSVGIDGTLDMTVSVPVGSALAEKLVPGNRPLIHKAIAQQTITVAVNGTLTKPALNREAMRGQLARIVQGAMKDAAKDAGAAAVDDLLKKGLDGLLKPKK